MDGTPLENAAAAMDAVLVDLFASVLAFRNTDADTVASQAASYRKGLQGAEQKLAEYLDSTPIRILRFRALNAPDAPEASFCHALAAVRDELLRLSTENVPSPSDVQNLWRRFTEDAAKASITIIEPQPGDPFDAQRHDAVAMAHCGKRVQNALTPMVAVAGKVLLFAKVRTD